MEPGVNEQLSPPFHLWAEAYSREEIYALQDFMEADFPHIAVPATLSGRGKIRVECPPSGLGIDMPDFEAKFRDSISIVLDECDERVGKHELIIRFVESLDDPDHPNIANGDTTVVDVEGVEKYWVRLAKKEMGTNSDSTIATILFRIFHELYECDYDYKHEGSVKHKPTESDYDNVDHEAYATRKAYRVITKIFPKAKYIGGTKLTD